MDKRKDNWHVETRNHKLTWKSFLLLQEGPSSAGSEKVLLLRNFAKSRSDNVDEKQFMELSKLISTRSYLCKKNYPAEHRQFCMLFKIGK